MTVNTDLHPEVVLDQLKQRHQAIWASGDYPAVVRDVVAPLGPVLVDAARVQPGDHVLDVAAGDGNAAIPAALRGARVVASDLTPELLDHGRIEARRRSAHLEWRVADAEALPFADRSFDVTMSSLGVMFAPHHQAAADELVRVTRPGGRIALLSWTPQGFIGRMFAAMKPFLPAPPPGVQPPPAWGDPDHVLALLGDRVEAPEWSRRTLSVDRFGTAEEFRQFFKRTYGPTIAAYRNVAAEPERVADLDRALVDLAREHMTQRGVMEWQYLLLTTHRA
jgi:ubiquinone/menaquinone biosynthesis C-methylase UbiE